MNRFSAHALVMGLAVALAATASKPIATGTPDARAPGRGTDPVAPSELALPLAAEPEATATWTHTEGAPGGGRHSPLTDINRENVASLEVVWHYRHGDAFRGAFPLEINRGSAFESTPIVVDGRLIFTTPRNRVIALDAETGRELWVFDPDLERDRAYANRWINRGVAVWRGVEREEVCNTRLYLATLDARLIALDAHNGRPCAEFGRGGTVDLREGIEPLHHDAEYGATSPPTIVGDVVVVGSSIADTLRPDAPPGDVRGFDARSGALRWTFHPIPHAGEAGAETWAQGRRLIGATNVWSTITADLGRGWIFLPVSTPSPDFFGGDRVGDDLFSDSVVALDAKTGRRVWHFQTVHHDLWDYDLAAPPLLVELELDGRRVEAVVQATKHGFVFVLDRETGRPLVPVEERPVPSSDLRGEFASPTQPFPIAPPALVPQQFTSADVYSPTEGHREACLRKLASLRNEGLFTPPSLRGSVVYPFTAGGANWSGASFDPASGRLFVPVNNLVHVVRLTEIADQTTGGGRDVKPLLGVNLRNIVWFLTGRGTGERYRLHPVFGRRILAVGEVPCNRPPWSEIVAVDLAKGSIAWRAPTAVGDLASAKASFGPALVTAGGLVFHGGTVQPILRVHDTATGERIAQFRLPAGLHAGPISYKLSPGGRQFIVVAPGGDVVIGSPLGDHVIAYALPRAGRETPSPDR